MGDAADDAYDIALRWQIEHIDLLMAGCRVCEECQGHGVDFDENECKSCLGFGWFDKHGNPCET